MEMSMESERTYLQHREHDAFEKGTRFVERTLQALVVLYIELFVRLNILSYCVKQYNR